MLYWIQMQQALQFAIHALKGSCDNIGAEKLYQLCYYLNNILKTNKSPKEQNWLKQLEQIFKETKTEIEKFVRNL